MRFPNYQAAVAYITAWCDNQPYTITSIDPADPRYSDTLEDCMDGTPEGSIDDVWVRTALALKPDGEYTDGIVCIESGDAYVGDILIFWDKEGKVVRVFGRSLYY